MIVTDPPLTSAKVQVTPRHYDNTYKDFNQNDNTFKDFTQKQNDFTYNVNKFDMSYMFLFAVISKVIYE